MCYIIAKTSYFNLVIELIFTNRKSYFIFIGFWPNHPVMYGIYQTLDCCLKDCFQCDCLLTFVRKLLVLVVKCPLLVVINIRTSYHSTGRPTRRKWLEKDCEYSPVSTSGWTESFQISSGVSELKPLMYAPK